MAYDVAALNSLDLQRAQVPLTGKALTIQRIDIRLNSHVGEWPEDPSQGLDYIGWIGTLPFPRSLVRNRIVEEVRTTPGVADVVDVTDDFNTDTNRYTMSFTVIFDDEDDSVRLGLEVRGPEGNGVPWATLLTGGAL